jgi:light-harvesting complex I chlorophyll a/b binding protein 1
LASIREDYTPGDLGFDPLNLKPADSESFRDMRTKELNNGRLAMIGTVGMLAQELVDHRGILEHFKLFGLGPATTTSV